ncbi:MAG: hypothetical protein GQ534_08535, partial [Candidatus Delongbacteria bacterium]|nr:hypothetical protein [Candidatus Delongbacteria bacterium]
NLNFCLIDDIEVIEGYHAKIDTPEAGVWDFESYTPVVSGFPIEGDIVDARAESVTLSGIIKTFKLDTLSMYEFTPDIPINFKYTWPTDYGALPWFDRPLKSEGKGKTNTEEIINSWERLKRIDSKTLKETEYPVKWGDEHFDLKNPGVYNIRTIVEDANPLDDEYIAVIPDTTQIIIPPWKLKLHGDFTYWDGTYNDQGFIPYIEKKEYSDNQDVKMYIWRPFLELPNFHNSTITISHNGSIIETFVEYEFDHYMYTANKTVGTYTEYGDTFGLTEGIEWGRTGNEDPGFYQIKATEFDDSLGVEIVQEKEIQICPMYYDFESLDWPDDWDKNASAADPTLWQRSYDADGEKPLENWNVYGYYDTYYHRSTSLETPEVTLNKDYNTLVSAWVSLPRVDSDWAPLVAQYLVQASVNGGEYFTVYEPVEEDYEAFDNATGTMNCMRPFFYSLGDSVSIGTTVKMKFKIIGDEYQYVDESSEKTEQKFVIDDIKIMYTKEEIPVGPIIESATQGVKSNQIVWRRNDSKIDSRTLDVYNVYKNGMKITTTVETTYIDTAVENYTTYEYAITRQIDHPTLKETSAFDCNISLTTTELTYPRPRFFELIQGAEIEQSNANLNWSPPKMGAIEYKIYRNGEYLNSTTDSTYTDCFLHEGDYSYYVIAKYSTPEGESWATDTKSITVSSSLGSTILPVIESFENNGLLPDGWSFDGGNTGEVSVADSSICDIEPIDGEFMIQFLTTLNSDMYQNSKEIISPTYDLSTCYNARISFNLFHTIDVIIWQPVFLRINSNIVSEYDLSDYSINQWNVFKYDLDESYLTDSVNISIALSIFSFCHDSLYIDNFQITAIEADPPANIVILRNDTNTILSWDEVTDAIKYYVYRSKKPDIDYVEVGTNTTNTFTDNSILDDGVYFYKIVSEIIVGSKSGGAK